MRLAEQLRDLGVAIQQLIRERDEARRDAERLARANNEMCDEIFALRSELADVRRKRGAA